MKKIRVQDPSSFGMMYTLYIHIPVQLSTVNAAHYKIQ